MTKITVEKTQVDKMFERIRNDSAIKKNVLQNIGQFGRTVLQNEANDITATGKLFSSMEYVIRGDTVEIGSRVPYAYEALETGTPPGTRVEKRELERWASLKLGDKGMAGAVARKIFKEGSKKFRNKGIKQFTRAVDTINLMLPTQLRKLAKYYAG